MSDNGGTPTIPILGGTGALGSGLAKRWAKAGANVVIGSRDAGSKCPCATRETLRQARCAGPAVRETGRELKLTTWEHLA